MIKFLDFILIHFLLECVFKEFFTIKNFKEKIYNAKCKTFVIVFTKLTELATQKHMQKKLEKCLLNIL